MILAAGHGTRMKSELPKVMHLFHGTPLVACAVNIAMGVSPRPPIVVVSEQSEMIRAHLGSAVTYAVQKVQRGTGDAVRSGLSAVPEDADTIVVLYGDMPRIQSSSILKLIEAHASAGASMSMLTATTPDFLDWRSAFSSFGRVVRSADGMVERIVEMKDATENERMIRELSTGVFCFQKSWLEEHLPLLKNENSQGEYYLPDLLGYAILDGSVCATAPVSVEEVVGVNSQEDLRQAHTLS